MYLILDIFFTILHIFVMIFNLTGWIWTRTRKAHLMLCLVTLASWFILGIWYGLGYCPLTDWHWAIKEKRGITGLPNSFAKWLIDSITGKNINADIIDMVVGTALLLSILAALYINFIHPRIFRPKQSRAKY